jgi:hypothetical protein
MKQPRVLLVKMTEEDVENAKILLSRVPLKGDEAFIYVALRQAQDNPIDPRAAEPIPKKAPGVEKAEKVDNVKEGDKT